MGGIGEPGVRDAVPRGGEIGGEIKISDEAIQVFDGGLSHDGDQMRKVGFTVDSIGMGRPTSCKDG